MDQEADAATFGQQSVKLGLITEAQLREAMDEAREKASTHAPELVLLTSTLERKGYMTNYQCAKVLRGDFDGFFMGGYRMLYKISSGSFGRVFRADDPRSGRVVAIKVLRRRWSEDQARIDLFIREGRVGMTLKHPNIVEVLAISQDPSSKAYYIVMEFVEGENLRQMLQRLKSPLDVPTALRIIEDATAGLAYAYSRGITHRDIKLTNLLISTNKEAKLVDFGLAQMFAAIGKEEEQVDRTVDYAGLERATAVKFGDVRSDIYFLGCVFYEMVTGRSPLAMTKDRHARMRKQRFEEVQPLRAGEIAAPPSVYQLTETMMTLDPQRRYQTPSQLLDAVRAARREVGAGKAGGRPATRTLFIVEGNQKMQNMLREKFRDQGFRVLLSADPMRALDRFRQQPYDALIVDGASAGEEGLLIFERILAEALEKRIPCAAVLWLREDQADLTPRITTPRTAVLVGRITFKTLRDQLQELLAQG
jgi:serine/threonine protein kinase